MADGLSAASSTAPSFRTRGSLAEEPDRSKVVVLAGPNGAGKSTYFDLFLRETGLPFVNADLIARAISAQTTMSDELAMAAARAAEAERRSLLERRQSFCMETVFSDPAGAKIAFLREAQAAGFRVILLFIGLDSAELSRARVIQRVAIGGHDVPDEKISSRFPRTLKNLREAVWFVDEARLYDNSDAQEPYRLIARVEGGRIVGLRSPIPPWMRDIVDPED